MSGGKYNSNRNSNISSNRKSYRDYNSNRYNSHSNYQSNPLDSNMYSTDGTKFAGSGSSNNRTYYNESPAQNDRHMSSYKKPYAYNSNYTKNSYYQNSDYQSKDYQSKDYQNSDYQNSDYQSKDYQNSDYQSKDYQSKDYQNSDYQSKDYQNSDYSNQRYESKRNYTSNYQLQATIANQGYRNDQNYQYTNNKFDQNTPSSFQPIKSINVLDKLINEPMRQSLHGDVIERYLSYCKSLLKEGTMKEQVIVEKFEDFKKLLFYDNLQDESTSIHEKLKKRRLEKDRAAKKSLLSKLSYGVSAIHFKNIEDVIARERTRLDELSLL